MTSHNGETVVLCSVTDYAAGTMVSESGVDGSKVVANGWTSAGGFNWQGSVSATGFLCDMTNLKADIDQEGGSFKITGPSAGKYAIVVILTAPVNFYVRLALTSDGAPVLAEVTSSHGADVGAFTVAS